MSAPRIVSVEAPAGGLALTGGRTMLRVVCEGSGVLEVPTLAGTTARLRFRGGLDALVAVPALAVVHLRVRRWPWGGHVHDVKLTLLAPAPAPIDGPRSALALPTELRAPAPRFRIPSCSVHLRGPP